MSRNNQHFPVLSPRSTRRFAAALVLCLVAAAVSVGCATNAEQLARAEAHYQNRAYGAAMANLENLEGHRDGLGLSERVRYNVARGLTHLHLNEREEARHWLAIAREEAAAEPTTLNAEQRAAIERVLAETDPLNASAATASGDASAAADASAAR